MPQSEAVNDANEGGNSEESRLPWKRIPADSRVRVVTFLSVQDNLTLNSAMTTKKDDLREDLEKSYKGAKIPGFDMGFCTWLSILDGTCAGKGLGKLRGPVAFGERVCLSPWN